MALQGPTAVAVVVVLGVALLAFVIATAVLASSRKTTILRPTARPAPSPSSMAPSPSLIAPFASFMAPSPSLMAPFASLATQLAVVPSNAAPNTFDTRNVIILLTCTVRVQRNIGHLIQTNAPEREATYKTSIKQWLTQTPFRVVAVENSGVQLSLAWLELDKNAYKDRYEPIAFDERNEVCAPHGNSSKGIHELYAINKAF